MQIADSTPQNETALVEGHSFPQQISGTMSSKSLSLWPTWPGREARDVNNNKQLTCEWQHRVADLHSSKRKKKRQRWMTVLSTKHNKARNKAHQEHETNKCLSRSSQIETSTYSSFYLGSSRSSKRLNTFLTKHYDQSTSQPEKRNATPLSSAILKNKTSWPLKKKHCNLLNNTT